MLFRALRISFDDYPQDPGAFGKTRSPEKRSALHTSPTCSLCATERETGLRCASARVCVCVCLCVSECVCICVCVAAAVENEDRTRPEQSMHEGLI